MADRAYPIEAVPDVPAAMARCRRLAAGRTSTSQPIAVGHRVVHGGPDYARPVLIDHGVVARLKRFVPLAPLHQPHNLAPIRSLLANFPTLPQVACFDTAFHRTHEPSPTIMPFRISFMPRASGATAFTGCPTNISPRRLPSVAPDIAQRRVIVAHLGSGASMCALQGRAQRREHHGFHSARWPADGNAVRADRSRSGALSDLRERDVRLERAGFPLSRLRIEGALRCQQRHARAARRAPTPRRSFAVDYFVYRIGLNAGMLAAALQGLDAFVFTAGIGENSANIRARVVEQLGWLGVTLDPVENARNSRLISRSDSRIPVYVVPTDEELMIAQHTLSLLMNGQSTNPRQERVS